MREHGLTFKEAVNAAILAGDHAREPFIQRTMSFGTPTVDSTKAVALAAEIENEELLRRQEARR